MRSLRAPLVGLALLGAAALWINLGPGLWRIVEEWGPREWFLYGPVAALIAAALVTIAREVVRYVRWRTEPPVPHELPTGAVGPRRQERHYGITGLLP